MFLVKVSFRGKNILLGKGISSLEEIEDQIRSRFPNQLPYGALVKYQGVILNNFKELDALTQGLDSKTIKLEVEPLPQSMIKVSSEKDISFEHSSVVEEKYLFEDLMEEQNKAEQNDDLYKCFYCNGELAYCNACQGRGKFSQDSKFIKHIDAIVKERSRKYLSSVESSQMSEIPNIYDEESTKAN